MPLDRMLGKLPPIFDRRTLRLANYYPREEAVMPATCHWDAAVKDWGTMGNDRWGNCVIVTAAHGILAMKANAMADTKRLTDAEVVALSRQMRALHGYNILTRLNYWRKKGMWGDKIYAYAAIDPQVPLDAKVAVYEFGFADIGLAMPAAWQDAEIWDVGTGSRYRPNTWGGHSVPVVGYDEKCLYVVTWGAIQPITWAAFDEYCDEAYAVMDYSWMDTSHKTPSGFDWNTLDADLEAFDD